MLRAMTVTRRRILVITATNMGCYRELIQGISSYGNTEGRWHLEICPPTYDFVQVIRSSKPDGMLLGALESTEQGRQAAAMVPSTVAVCRGYLDTESPLPAVEADDFAVGAAGAEHLLAKGFRHFAFVGQEVAPWSTLRQQGFEGAVKKAGCSTAVYEVEWGLGLNRPVRPSLVNGPFDHWLTQQHRPLGIVACNDGAARTVSRICLDLGLRVPDDVAILGIDNDDLSTAICNPPLSSVIIPWRLMGRTASQLLDRLMDGEGIPQIVEKISPAGIAERQSTGTMAIEDEQLRTAVRFIRENAGTQITVNEVVAAAGTTRRALERKFRATLRRSPLEEIRRCRIKHAEVLLSQTSLTTKQIAQQSGFGSLTWFTTAFREINGASPAAYRKNGK